MTTGGDACNVDSGSDLIYRKNGQNIAVGITSFARGDCNNGPVVYTKVKFLREQISEWALGSRWCKF